MMEENDNKQPEDWTHYHGWFNELTGESGYATTYYLHDNEDGRRIGFRRQQGSEDVEVIFNDPEQCSEKIPKILGTITLNENLHVVKFLEEFKPKTDPATIDEEIILLRKMAALLAEFNLWQNTPKCPPGTINSWRKENYISNVVPGKPLAAALEYLHLQYQMRFGKTKNK